MIRISHTITETKDGNRSTWITTRKVFVFGILFYSFSMTETGSNDKRNIGFQTGGIPPITI
jgi:hypothetical protein